MSLFREIVEERQRLADKLRHLTQHGGAAKDKYGQPLALRWDQWPRDENGFPAPPEKWWNDELWAKYGPVSRRTIIELLSERANASMDDYVHATDTELTDSYDEAWEYLVEIYLTCGTYWDEKEQAYIARNETYPELQGTGYTEDEAQEALEKAVLFTNDIRFNYQ